MKKEKEEFELLTISEWFEKEVDKNGDDAIITISNLLDIDVKDFNKIQS
jgi:hypothetical protein